MKKQEQKDLTSVWVVSSTERILNYWVSQYSRDLASVKFASVP